MTPTILITGRDGQLGFELRRTLAPLARVVAVDIDNVDFSDLDAVRRLVVDSSADVIVNAAAYTAVDRAETERDLAHRINGDIPGVLAAELKKQGGRLMVHYSTDYVFSGTATRPYTEDETPQPVNAYGESKLSGEFAVRQAGIPNVTFRTEWLYATRGKNFLLTILRLASEGKPLRIIADQVGAPTWARMLGGRQRASDRSLPDCLRRTGQHMVRHLSPDRGWADHMAWLHGGDPDRIHPVPAAPETTLGLVRGGVAIAHADSWLGISAAGTPPWFFLAFER